MAAGVFVSGFVSAMLQFEAMRVIPAASAQPFAALQPFFAALFGLVALGEPLTVGTTAGAFIMIGSALLACSERDLKREAKVAEFFKAVGRRVGLLRRQKIDEVLKEDTTAMDLVT